MLTLEKESGTHSQVLWQASLCQNITIVNTDADARYEKAFSLSSNILRVVSFVHKVTLPHDNLTRNLLALNLVAQCGAISCPKHPKQVASSRAWCI